jgi:hypothetical protein
MNGVAVLRLLSCPSGKQGSPSTHPIQGDECGPCVGGSDARLNLRNLCTAFPLVEVR